jgi:hypothetical protein
VVLLIVAVGLLNMGLGFGVACYCGWGPPGLHEAWEALAPIPRVQEMNPPADDTDPEAAAEQPEAPALPQT